ncbi:nuclease [Halonotius terrestris]|uniref:Nuclease n=1 Tax=Halonotius terrestris TaxID=2487750 RepID=A0A8J8PAX5_9EURY|nr:thermonuclease family protein [Halonotius terrestris]TQQ82931.1 nuclease [Halonotius terrestris]
MQHRRRLIAVIATIAVVALTGCSGLAPLPTPDAEPTAAPVDTVAGPSWNVTVTHVVDGDTVDIRYENGSTETVRLLGVDTPETPPNQVGPDEFEGIPDTDAGRDHLTMWGGRATDFAERELAGQDVRLVVDPEADRRGGYGRLLAYIYVDGENFNKQLLAGGYARLYDSPFTLRDEFAATEATAREEGVGLWGFDE